MGISNYINRIKRIIEEGYNYTKYSSFPAGHYYSPIVNLDEYKKIGNPNLKGPILDIDLRENQQTDLVAGFTEILKEAPDWDTDKSLRYQFDNKWFARMDGLFLYAMIRKFKPQRIIEVGSGYSSALMLDTNERFMNNSIQFSFIEPNPERLESLLRQEDYKNTSIIKQFVQSVNLDVFKSLKANDILFIDSSHITKSASDVNFLFFNILPILPSGVIIHVHDIFYPLEYPENWITDGRNWNEIYLLRAFLQNNKDYEIVLFIDQLKKNHPSLFDANTVFRGRKDGSGFYMVKK